MFGVAIVIGDLKDLDSLALTARGQKICAHPKMEIYARMSFFSITTLQMGSWSPVGIEIYLVFRGLVWSSFFPFLDEPGLQPVQLHSNAK